MLGLVSVNWDQLKDSPKMNDAHSVGFEVYALHLLVRVPGTGASRRCD